MISCKRDQQLTDYITSEDLAVMKQKKWLDAESFKVYNDSVLILKDSSILRIHEGQVFIQKFGAINALYPEKIPHLRVPIRFSMIQATLDSLLVPTIKANQSLRGLDTMFLSTPKQDYYLYWNGNCYSLQH